MIIMPPKKKPTFNVVKKAPPKKKPTFNVIKKKAPNFNTFYQGKLNSFLNDIMDSKSKKTNRKVGLTRVENKFDKLVKKIPFPTNKEVKDFYNKEYPDKDYYLDN